MTDQPTLLETILSLIHRKTEGPYWDFKLLHHENKAKPHSRRSVSRQL